MGDNGGGNSDNNQDDDDNYEDNVDAYNNDTKSQVVAELNSVFPFPHTGESKILGPYRKRFDKSIWSLYEDTFCTVL